MMRTGTTKASDVFSAVRFDSKYFLDEGKTAAYRVARGRWTRVTPGGTFGNTNIWVPGRSAAVFAESEEFGKPYLVPYDCLRYVPDARHFLSQSQVADYSNYEVRRGWLLVVCSGRNLGPVVMVDSFLERFVVSGDMIRIAAALSDEVFYFYGVMNTKLGQALIRRDKIGSVIDHISPKQLATVHFPLDEHLMEVCAGAFRRSFETRERARINLRNTIDEYSQHVGLTGEQMKLRRDDIVRRFATKRSQVTDRTDSEPFAPAYQAFRKRIAAGPNPRPIGQLADVVHLGRKKTLHVSEEKYGVRILSGRQMAQYRPVGLKIVSHQAWDDLQDYVLSEGTVLLTCDGRAEDNLADCALVRKDRAGWAATEHILRLMPKPGIHPGLLYLACSCKPVQQILKSLATGSVVDAIRVPQVAPMVVPYPDDRKGIGLGDAAVEAWDLFAEASRTEAEAVAALENEFS